MKTLRWLLPCAGLGLAALWACLPGSITGVNVCGKECDTADDCGDGLDCIAHTCRGTACDTGASSSSSGEVATSSVATSHGGTSQAGSSQGTTSLGGSSGASGQLSSSGGTSQGGSGSQGGSTSRGSSSQGSSMGSGSGASSSRSSGSSRFSSSTGASSGGSSQGASSGARDGGVGDGGGGDAGVRCTGRDGGTVAPGQLCGNGEICGQNGQCSFCGSVEACGRDCLPCRSLPQSIDEAHYYSCAGPGQPAATACLIQNCSSNRFANCDQLDNNQCEMNIRLDEQNCGGCGQACGATDVCTNFQCTCTAGSCPSGQVCGDAGMCLCTADAGCHAPYHCQTGVCIR